jgi:hypothetical protein
MRISARSCMDCPYCGSTVKDKDICLECGKKIDTAEEVEIEYKEFKVSEFLEIRRKQDGARSGSAEAAGKHVINARKFSAARGAGFRKKKAGMAGEADRSPGVTGNKTFLIVTMIVIAAAMAGAFYLSSFLAQR